MKRCNKCKEEKPLELFNKRLLKDGTNAGTTYCKKCVQKTTAIWQKANPKKVREFVKKSQLKNIERVRAYDRKWKKENYSKIKPKHEAYLAKKFNKGTWDVYLLPEEHYCGQSDQLGIRLRQHKRNNRIIDDWVSVMQFDNRRDALKLESCFHKLGWLGGKE